MEEYLTLRELSQMTRQLVLEHPYAADLEVVLHPHGTHHRQGIREVHLNLNETKVVLEAER